MGMTSQTQWWGKVVGSGFGLLVGGPLGALVGLALGHHFDTEGGLGLLGTTRRRGEGSAQNAFFTALFSVMGHLAKADGRVSEAEVAAAENIMARMELSDAQRGDAIRLFNEGKRDGFALDNTLARFRRECRGQRDLARMFIEILLETALADGRVDAAEQRILYRTCHALGFSGDDLDELISMRGATGWRRRSSRRSASGAQRRRDPYAVLGVARSASDAEIKRAYRKLMSQHHPDKLAAKGMPEEMAAIAQERTREIRSAYDEIRERRHPA